VRLQTPFKEIANELDLSPETFSRTLAQLQKEGLISRSHRTVTLHEHP
jgi:CRP-like cAMP-binding protein